MEDPNSSDSEPETFLPDSLFQYQERQREDNHPVNMAPLTRNSKRSGKGTKKGAPSKRKPSVDSDSESEHSDLEPDQENQEGGEVVQELRKKLAIAQARVKRSKQKGSRRRRSRKGKSSSSAIDNLVYDTVKSELFKEVKFISNDDELMYTTKLVMNMLDLKDHQNWRMHKPIGLRSIVIRFAKPSTFGGTMFRASYRSM